MDTPITAGSKIVITKGCKAREVTKGTRALVVRVEPVDGSFVKVVLALPSKRMGLPDRHIAFYARHHNRLADAVIGMNDGNPLHRIEVRRA